MINPPDDPTPTPGEDTKYANIYIPVPYDPQIPGVRCVDADQEDIYIIEENLCALHHQCENALKEIKKLERILRDKQDGQITETEYIELNNIGCNTDSGSQTENIELKNFGCNTDSESQDIEMRDIDAVITTLP